MEDPLERAVLLAIAVLTVVLVWPLVHGEERPGTSTGDACVTSAVREARAFAAALGDERPVPTSFARRACQAR